METLELFLSRLGRAAKADTNRRFYSLKDKICRMDNLKEAWKRVRVNNGAAGANFETIEDIERSGVEQFLRGLQRELETETYEVQCIRRVFIPKPNGGQRPLGIPTVKDRVVQQAVRLVIEPIFEADFQPFSFGYRPNKSARQASQQVYQWLLYGLTNVIDIDIDGFFDHIDHDKLISFVMERVTDGYVIKLIREWLRAGVVYLGGTTYPEEGTPQGGVISPLLANIYLNKLDALWTKLGMNDRYRYDAQLVRYADDIVILTSKQCATNFLGLFEELLSSNLGLRLSKEKTRITTASKGFDFLGFHYARRFSKARHREVTRFVPSHKSVAKFKTKVKEITALCRTHARSESQVIQELNPLIIGWTNYFNHSNACKAYSRLECFVEWKLMKFICRRHKLPYTTKGHSAFLSLYNTLGLRRLRGRILHKNTRANGCNLLAV